MGSRRYNNAVQELQAVDTPLPGRGLGEIVILETVMAVLGIVAGLAVSRFAAPTWEAVPGVVLDTWAAFQLFGVLMGFLWFMVVTGFAADLLATFRKQPEPALEFELGPAPDEEEQARPEPLVRGVKWRDIDTYVAKVLLWKEHEERQGKTSWRQELAREWGLGKFHKALTQMLEDAGALVDYGPQRTGRLVILNRGEIIRRISMLK